MKKKKILFGIIGAAALAFCGCGNKTAVIEPEVEVEEPEDVTATDEDAAEAADDSVITDADFDSTWAMIQEYGFAENGCSNLSFELKGDSINETDDYYEMQAYIMKGVEIPASLAVGDSVTFTRTDDQLQATEITVTKNGDNTYITEDEYEYYSFEDADSDNMITLYCDSDDRVETVFYVGTIRVAKDAKVSIDLTNEEWDLTMDDIATNEYGDNHWYNGVKFDENGVITDFISFGD